MRDYFKERSQCQNCFETGFMVASVDGQEVLICCDCSFGDSAHEEHHIKQWHVSQRDKFKTLPLDPDWFKPEPGLPGKEKIWRWSQMVKHAQEFWSLRS